MSYKLEIRAFSHIGDNVQCAHEAIYADRVTSLSDGVYSPLELTTKSKGKKHLVSLFSDTITPVDVCNSLDGILDKPNYGNLSIKIQYALKDAVDTMYEKEIVTSPDTSMSMLYIDGQNVYVAGYGDINIYRYSAKDKTASKVEFIAVPDENPVPEQENEPQTDTAVKVRQPSRVRRIPSVKAGDEYLLVGNSIAGLFSDEHIIEIFTQYGYNAAAYLIDEARAITSGDNLTVIHVTTNKDRVALSVTLNIIVLLCALAVAAYFAFPHFFHAGDDSDGNAVLSSAEVDSSASSNGDEEVVSDALVESHAELVQVNTLQDVVPELGALASLITGEQSKTAYYVKNLNNGDVIVDNDSQMYSESLIKLYIMAEVYRQAYMGELVYDDNIKSLLTEMITVNNKDASNSLVSIVGGGDQGLGFQRINDNAAALGCNYTMQSTDLQDVMEVSGSVGNYTSVADCGLLLEKIYYGELVSPEASAEMLELLKQQQQRTKIPAGIPDGVVVANQTGESGIAQNDVAVVYTDAADYIICIMVNDFDNESEDTEDIIAQMSKAVYEYITVPAE